MTEKLSIGYPIVIAQTTAYALPARRVQLFATTTTGLQLSNTSDFNVALALTLDANAQAEVSAAFVRCTTSTNIITLKPL